jgi:hypothetical protein
MIPLSLFSVAAFHAMFLYFAMSLNQKAISKGTSSDLPSNGLRLA